MDGRGAVRVVAGPDDLVRPIAANRRQVVLVPVALVVPFDVHAVTHAGCDAHDRRGQDDLLDLRAGLGRAIHVDRIRRIDAAGFPDAFAPADDLVTHADARNLVAYVELLADPQVEQARLEADVLLGIGREAAAQIGRRVVEQVLSAGCACRSGTGVVVLPGAPCHEREPLRRHLQDQLVVALEIARERISLAVVDVALIGEAAQLTESAAACLRTGGHVVGRRHEIAARRRRANADTRRYRRIEAAFDVADRERERVRAAAPDGDKRRDCRAHEHHAGAGL